MFWHAFLWWLLINNNIFPIYLMATTTFTCRISFSSSLPVFKIDIFPCYWIVWFPYIFLDINKMCGSKIYSFPHFYLIVLCVFWLTEWCNPIYFYLFRFFFLVCVLYFGGHTQKIIAVTNVSELLAYSVFCSFTTFRGDFCRKCKAIVNFIFLHMNIQLFIEKSLPFLVMCSGNSSRR